MNRFLIILVIFIGISSSAYASCPDLSGDYGIGESSDIFKLVQTGCEKIENWDYDSNSGKPDPEDPDHSYLIDGISRPVDSWTEAAFHWEGSILMVIMKREYDIGMADGIGKMYINRDGDLVYTMDEYLNGKLFQSVTVIRERRR